MSSAASSVWVQFAAPSGTAGSSQVSRSARTSGEAFSFSVSEAEVCWISRCRSPTSRSPSSGSAPTTSPVTRWMPRGRGSKVIVRCSHIGGALLVLRDSEPEVRRHRFDLHPDPFQLDLVAAGMLEEANAVAEHDRLHEDQHLVELP